MIFNGDFLNRKDPIGRRNRETPHDPLRASKKLTEKSSRCVFLFFNSLAVNYVFIINCIWLLLDYITSLTSFGDIFARYLSAADFRIFKFS